MLFTAVATLAFAAIGLAAALEGYRTVYITLKQDTKFVIVPKTRTNGSTLVCKYNPDMSKRDNGLLTKFVQSKPHLQVRPAMVHQSEPDQDPTRRYNTLHGCRAEIRVERHGKRFSEAMREH
jgi:hypothetical protein